MRWKAAVIGSITAILVACSVASQPQLLQNALKTADRAVPAFAAGDYERARSAFEEAILELHPGTPEYYGDMHLVFARYSFASRLGWLDLFENKPQEARDHFTDALLGLSDGLKGYGEAVQRDRDNAEMFLSLTSIALNTALTVKAQRSGQRVANVPRPYLPNFEKVATRQFPTVDQDGTRITLFPEFGWFTPIGKLTSSDSSCTATLVGWRLALTAAHCVTNDDGSPHGGEYDFTLTPYPGLSVTVRVTEIRTRSGKGWDKDWNDDWAVLVLEHHPKQISTKEYFPFAGYLDGKEFRALSLSPNSLSAAGFSADLNHGDFLSVDWGCTPIRSDREVLETKCRWWHGASGGPVMLTHGTYEGDIVAIVSHSTVHDAGDWANVISGAVLSETVAPELDSLRKQLRIPRSADPDTAMFSDFCRREPASCS